MLRTIIESISRNIVLKRRLPDSLGGKTIYVSPGSALSYWMPGFSSSDLKLLDIAKEVIKSGDVVWDIGANVGLFSFAALNLVGSAGRVLSVEADSFLVNLLRRSAGEGLLKNPQIDILPMAVSNYNGTGMFNLAKRGRASNFLDAVKGSTQSGGVYKKEEVDVVTLDWLLSRYPAPNVVKIDIEGSEYKAFQGASTLLKEARPKLICEIHDENADPITSILQQNGYIIYDAEAVSSERKPLQRAVFNTLACPLEKQI